MGKIQTSLAFAILLVGVSILPFCSSGKPGVRGVQINGIDCSEGA